jgi:hypothetical protein
MGKRIMTTVVIACVIAVMAVGVVLAADQTNGTGRTHNHATIGFNAKLDLKGEITYVTHDSTQWWVQCDDVTSYRNLTPDGRGGLRTKVTAECQDKDGTTLWAEFYFVDRGEPGTHDIIRAFFTYDSNYAMDANGDPAVWLTQCNSGVQITDGCMDSGRIRHGNVQIHQDADSMETVVTSS